MAHSKKKPVPMKSRKNGVKHAKRIQKNLEVLKKVSQ